MSEYFDVEPEDDEPTFESKDGSVPFEPDPGVVAFLDQQAAAFQETADQFEEVYGFRHDCHCDKDYAEGKVGEVTECYANMVSESLDACAKFNHENKQLRAMVGSLIEMNNNLMDAAVGEAGEDAVIQAEIEQFSADESDQG